MLNSLHISGAVVEAVVGTILGLVAQAAAPGFQLPQLHATLVMLLHWQWAAVAAAGSAAAESLEDLEDLAMLGIACSTQDNWLVQMD